jgi:allantoinase
VARGARGEVSWIVSDHACCSTEMKVSSGRPDDIWLAKSGFGGTEYLLSGVFSEGSKRGLPYHRMAELCSQNPARRYGLLGKGDVAPGYDADLALLDPNQTFTVRAADSPSGKAIRRSRGRS